MSRGQIYALPSLSRCFETALTDTGSKDPVCRRGWRGAQSTVKGYGSKCILTVLRVLGAMVVAIATGSLIQSAGAVVVLDVEAWDVPA